MNLRTSLLKKIMPLTVLPPLLITIWSGIITWQGANWGGYGWVKNASRATALILETVQETLKNRVEKLASSHILNESIESELKSDESLILISETGMKTILSKDEKLNPPWVEQIIERLENKTDEGIFVGYRNENIFFLTKKVLKNNTFLLLKRWDDKFIDLVSRTVGTEITVFTPGGNFILTSWKNKAHERTRQTVPEDVISQVKDTGIGKTYVVKYSIEVPKYLGLFPELEGWGHNAGDDSFGAYHAFSWINSPINNQVAILANSVPEGALLSGPAQAILGSVGIFIVVLILSLIVVYRLAGSFVTPISLSSKQIKSISDALSEKLPEEARIQLEEKKKPDRSLPMEIDELNAVTINLINVEHKFNQMEQELEGTKLKMYQASKFAALGEMAGGIAHEINNPLTIIQGKTRQILRSIDNQHDEDESRKKITDAVSGINATVERIATIVRGLRTFARTGQKDPLHETKIAEIVKDVTTLCGERIRLNNIEFRVCEINEDLMIPCRSAQISQVLLNLLNNSFDAVQSLDTKWIEINIGKIDDYIEFSVIDSGGGIPEWCQNKIMQPFFTTKEVGKGTGLGLSISKGIIEDHGGRMFIDKASKNTKFSFLLPQKR